ncbi:MAG: DUF4382 domain-containing protein [Gemmatimonadetes bacterium]|nr:DUF4382 domain-containing protein [Gemmatimonadota bacterium]NNM04691.1 DUF4382 domain-containing protein [Gemmatimonadota bacterium]
MKTLRWIPGLAAACLLLLGACDDATGPEEMGQIQILLTDAPADYIESAEVWISRAYLKGGSDEGEETEEESENGGPINLFEAGEGDPLYFDLLTLQDGITANLTSAEGVEAGVYRQLRLVVDDAVVTLKPGYEFKNGGVSEALKVPSGMTSGIKVHLNGPIEITEGTLTIVTVDFDVNDNFKLQGNPDTPAGINGVLFTPTLKEKGRTEEEVSG